MVTLPPAAVYMTREPGSATARVALTVPGEATREVFDAMVRDAKARTSVDGFKKGKAPDALVIGQVGRDRLKSNALATLIQHYVQTAVADNPELNAIGEPEVVDDSAALIAAFAPGEPLELTLEVELWPEVSVPKDAYEGLEVEVEVPPFNQEAYDETLRQLRQRQARLEDLPADTVAKEGDHVRVDMAGFEKLESGEKGDPLDVASGEGLSVELAVGKFMPGLVEGLLGCKAGETRLVPVQFSSRSQQAQLAGKELLFEVTVHSVQRRVLPELDDDFAAGIQPGLTLEGLNEKVRDGVQAEVDKMVRERTHMLLERLLVDKYLSNTPVPAALADEQARKSFAQMLTNIKDRGDVDDEALKQMVTPEAFEQYKAEYAEEIARAVRASLLVDAVAAQEGIAVDQADIEEQKAMMASVDKEVEKVDQALLVRQIEATLLRDRVLAYIAEKATVTKVPMQEKEGA